MENLTVGYERPGGRINIVVSDVSFVLEAGSILGLAGESGCGKSTTALAALGYQGRGGRVLRGSSRLDGLDLLNLPPAKLRSIWGRRVAYVAQDASAALNPALPIGRQLAQPLVTHLGLNRSRLRARQVELLDSVGFRDPAAALARYPHQFSGGQQQRIAIALALSCGPAVLILDEPTTGLDVTTQARLSSLLRALVRETGVATLYVNHDLALLATLANRLAIMYAGQIHEIGSTEAVCVRPSHPYTQALMAAVPSARNLRSVAGLGGRPPSTCSLDGCSFAPRCPHVIAECRVGHISLREVDDGHFARCIRAGEVRAPIPTGLLLQGHLRPKADPLLKVEDVWCGYRSGGTSVAAVRGVSFGISRAETLSVVGESGSGKSTLLRAIIGLHAPTAGSITFRGEKLAKRASERAPSIRRELQLIFQNPDSSLNPRHTVARIIGRPMRLFRDDITRSQEREAVAELLEAVKLPRSLLDRYPSELSGGQKQRVALARAFAPRPSLLLCDEVTTSLDVSVQATILELISELAQSHGTAVIFVSHDLAVVRSIATRVLVMRQGEVCEEADAEQLFLSPSHPYTQELLSAIPELPIISPT